MYKLYINNLQVGNYKTMKDMMSSAVMTYCCGHFIKSMKWDGNKLFITHYDNWELKKKK